MVSDELVQNTRRNMLDTLGVLSSIRQQQTYQDKVPYVDVPVELLTQWDGWSALFSNQDWFRNSLSQSELEAVEAFDTTFRKLCESFNGRFPSIDQLSTDSRWKKVRTAANDTLKAFS